MGFDGDVADELAIGVQSLSLAAREPAVDGEIGIHDGEAFVHRVVADHLDHEALTVAVAARDESERPSALGCVLQISDEGLGLLPPSHRDVFEAAAGDHPRRESIHHRHKRPLGYLRHSISLPMSSAYSGSTAPSFITVSPTASIAFPLTESSTADCLLPVPLRASLPFLRYAFSTSSRDA